MADISVEHRESSVSSVRSTVSTASSGYAIVSVPGKQRGDVRSVYPSYPQEPPPDYDDEATVDKDGILYKASRPTCSRQSSPKKDLESKMPLLSQETVQTEAAQQTIVRINSRSNDINIEIVSNPAQSPASTTADSSFLFHAPKEQKKFSDGKCCKFTTREKVLSGVLVVVCILLVGIILNFTVCIGEFTSACD